MRLRTILAAALVAVPLQVGCDFEAFADSDRYKEDFQYSYDLRPGGRVSLETFNGSVEILSWEKNSVQITGTKYAGHEEDMRDIKIDVQAGADAVRIRAIRPEGRLRRGNMGARFVLRVPREVELERVASSNGPLRVEDVRGNARLETSNGSIRIRKFEGSLTARTSNGGVEGYGIAGDAEVRTSNGTVRLEDLRGGLSAETSNAGINVQRFEPKSASPIRLTTSNGTIDIALDQFSGNELRATTSNASIVVRMPSDIKAQLRASTSNGVVSTDFDVSGRIDKHHIDGTINGGGPLLSLTTSNGSVRVNRM